MSPALSSTTTYSSSKGAIREMRPWISATVASIKQTQSLSEIPVRRGKSHTLRLRETLFVLAGLFPRTTNTWQPTHHWRDSSRSQASPLFMHAFPFEGN